MIDQVLLTPRTFRTTITDLVCQHGSYSIYLFESQIHTDGPFQNTNVEHVLQCCHRKLLLLSINKVKLTFSDPVPKRRVSACMKKFVPHITRPFILSVQVITVQRMYHNVLDHQNLTNFCLVA